ncbi:MAG: tetratricopeptide repeat protein [Sphingobacteriaceae bacterium]|nr:tetratricopeptide repeat protein [Sphingobacteriaceae bacterium]
MTYKEIYEESQNNIDRALNIQNTSATFVEILSGLIALILTVAGLFGFFEYRRWKKLTKDMSADHKYFKNLKQKTEKELEILKNKMTPSDQILTEEKPSAEVLKKLEEMGDKLSKLEMLGVSFEPDDYVNRGNALFYKNDFVNAIHAYDKAIELESNNFDAWSNKALCYNKLLLFDKAIEAAKKAIEINPKRTEIWNSYGVALMSLKQVDEAFKCFLKSIELNKSNIPPFVNIARIYNKQGKYNEAIEYAWRL